MKKLLLLTSGIALATALPASANEELMTQMDNADQWAIQTGDYANQRFF